MEIKDIYTVQFMQHKFNYVGCLRNEKKFSINDVVFIGQTGGKIFKGIIVGVELPPSENPEYKYKIQIPKWICSEKGDGTPTIANVICDYIFHSIDEAKESAIKNLERMASLQREEIEQYFNKYKED